MNAEETQNDQQHYQQNNQMPPQHEPIQEQPGQLSETQQLINIIQQLAKSPQTMGPGMMALIALRALCDDPKPRSLNAQ